MHENANKDELARLQSSYSAGETLESLTVRCTQSKSDVSLPLLDRSSNTVLGLERRRTRTAQPLALLGMQTAFVEADSRHGSCSCLHQFVSFENPGPLSLQSVEHGTDCAYPLARRGGFESVGPLRTWRDK